MFIVLTIYYRASISTPTSTTTTADQVALVTAAGLLICHRVDRRSRPHVFALGVSSSSSRLNINNVGCDQWLCRLRQSAMNNCKISKLPALTGYGPLYHDRDHTVESLNSIENTIENEFDHSGNLNGSKDSTDPCCVFCDGDAHLKSALSREEFNAQQSLTLDPFQPIFNLTQRVCN